MPVNQRTLHRKIQSISKHNGLFISGLPQYAVRRVFVNCSIPVQTSPGFFRFPSSFPPTRNIPNTQRMWRDRCPYLIRQKVETWRTWPRNRLLNRWLDTSFIPLQATDDSQIKKLALTDALRQNWNIFHTCAYTSQLPYLLRLNGVSSTKNLRKRYDHRWENRDEHRRLRRNN